jgi:D-glycero-D-manno-heptose 1,7-bisphosphate phosphatase
MTINQQRHQMKQVLFLDRDGVINEDRGDYVKSWQEFKFIKGVRPALKIIKEAQIPVVIITNQSIIGRDMVSEPELTAIHGRMRAGIKKGGGEILNIYYCPHRPEDRCRCRKPRIGLLKQAAREFDLDLKECLFVGDSLKDLQAGKRAGCKTILVQTGQGEESLKKILSGKTRVRPDWIFPSLGEAIPIIIDFFRTGKA